MPKNKWIPIVEDLSEVKLSSEVENVIEIVAENVHNVWAEARIAEGWTYAEKYDHTQKLTPNLVPYSQLPESEKDYDRNTALGTIKMLSKLGFEIVKKA